MRLPTLVSLLLAGAVAGLAVPVPAPQAAKPPAPKAAAPSSPSQVTGTVLETMESGGYTYMKLKTSSGEVWAAFNKTAIKKGDTATLAEPMPMEKFESKTLNRKFDRIYFGSLATRIAAAAGSAALPPGHPAVGGPASGNIATQHAAAAEVPPTSGRPRCPRRPDGRTVAEIYAQKAALKDKTLVSTARSWIPPADHGQELAPRA